MRLPRRHLDEPRLKLSVSQAAPSMARPYGPFSRALSAGPPSPENPGFPVPANAARLPERSILEHNGRRGTVI